MEESQRNIIEKTEQQNFKRNVAHKLRIGKILNGSPIIENERLKHIVIHEKKIIRVNIIANIIDKYIQDGEKKFGSITLDDASGQIKAKVFGEDIEKFSAFNQGDTVLVVGLLRVWNNELYLTPEIIKKKDTRNLLVRKLEAELEQPKTLDREKIAELKDKIILMLKEGEKNGGVDVDRIIMELKEQPQAINQEIKNLRELCKNRYSIPNS